MSYLHPFARCVTHFILAASSLSDFEFISIVGHYNRLVDTRGTVDPSLEHRGYSPEALKVLKERLKVDFTPVTSCGIRFTRPLNDFEYPQLGYVLTLFENYERGVMPFEGPLTDQPGKVIEAFNLLSAIRREREELTRAANQERERVRHKRQSKL